MLLLIHPKLFLYHSHIHPTMLHKILLSIVAFMLPLLLSGKVYLVSVGISDYPGDNDLRLPVNDANVITWIYEKNADLKYCKLLNKQATKQNILAAMRQVYRNAQKNDVVVFYFSGHGSGSRNGLQAYNGELTYAEIRETMSKSKCLNKTMFIDACYAGNLRSQNNDEATTQAADSLSRTANVMLFLSSRGNETSGEVSTWKNGIFTTYLQKGMRGDADTNKDRIITAREIFEYVNPKVVKLTGKLQHPVMWGNFPDDMPVMIWKKTK